MDGLEPVGPSEYELRAIFDWAISGIVVVARDGRITAFNPAAERLVGLPASQVLGKHIEEVIPSSGLLRVMETGIPQTGQKVRVGNTTLVSNRAPIFKDEQVVGAIAVFQNVSDLENLIDELTAAKASLETLEAIVDYAWDWIVVVDKNGIITMINQRYCDFLGVTKEEAIGSHVTKIIENTRMHIVAQTGVPEIGHAQMIKGQEMICMRIPIRKNGEVVGAVGKSIFKDVGELRDLAQRLHILESKVAYYEQVLRHMRGARYGLDDIVGNSPPMKEAKRLIEKAARLPSNVLITGETGTGKELAAHAIHALSPRSSGPFIRVNCAAIPRDLLESELFGYEPGAFTGACKTGKPGKFELASGGTIFLDEIGDTPPDMQAKLLRVIQEKEFERVGGVQGIRVDCRIVCATNRDLEALISEGKFRSDLYYRLNVISIHMPSLRQMREDIPLLTDYFMGKISCQMGVPPKHISKEVIEAFTQYDWPGNARELYNVIERFVNVVEADTVEIRHLPRNLRSRGQVVSGQTGDGLKEILREAEREAILNALKATGGNKKRAAALLNLPRSVLYEKMEALGLREPPVGRRSI